MIASFRDIQKIAGGFQVAKIFLTANDLGLFTAIGAESRTAGDLAGRLRVDARALELMLNALTAVGLLQKEQEGRYRNHPVVCEHLGDPATSRGAIFRHIHHCWDSWSRLPKVVRSGRPDFAAEANALGDDAEWTRDFIQGMNDVTRDLAPQVAPQLPLGQASVLLDVGGGPGTYAAAFSKAWPKIREIRLFDLPDALEIGRRNLEQWGFAERVTFQAGNFDDDPLPAGNDAVWLSQVLHSQGEAACQGLIDKCFAALNPGGQLLVHEFLLDDDRAAPPVPAIFAVHMLVMTEQGRSYSGEEIGSWMRRSGFEKITILRVSDDTRVVSGEKPL